MRSFRLSLACAAFAAVAVILPTMIPAVAFAQQVVQAVVQPPSAVWWGEIANAAITALAGVLATVVTVGARYALPYIRSKSKLAAMFFTQSLFDKLVAGIQNEIRVQAEDLKERIPGGVNTTALTPDQKREIVAGALPKLQDTFSETLTHLDKVGAAPLHDMILGRIDQALAKPVAAPSPATPPNKKG